MSLLLAAVLIAQTAAATPSDVPRSVGVPPPVALDAGSASALRTPPPEDARGEATALFDQAMADYQAGNCDAAMPALATVAAANEHAEEAAVALRDCYSKKYGTGATAQLEKEVAAEPGNALAHDDLGAFYLLDGRFDESRRELSRALELDPKNLDARFNLAFWYSRVGQPHAAIQEHLSILKDAPDDKRSLTELCYLVSEQENDPKRAEPYCAQAAVGQESNEMVEDSLGLVRMRAGDLDGAQKAFETVLAAHPDDASARTFVGAVKLRRKDYAGAETEFQTVLAADPTFNEARLQLAETYEEQRRYPEAITQFRAAYHQDRNGLTLGSIARVYLQEYFLLVIGVLLAAMAALLWRYLNPKAPMGPTPTPATS